ncbi:MAG: CDP-glucose 4,6-dehydratase [Hyphomicrobiales bacterium]|nr:CDP-glucose 4,6-dehydratase [Hyphomicrobiales bacterium]
MISAEFWRGRRVFLTGHTGFKGAWACAMLNTLGAEVTGFALDPPTTPSLFEMAKIGARITDIRGDVRDTAHVGQAMRDSSPDIVIHMAAQSLVRASYAQPLETYAVNVMGSVNVLDAARKAGAGAVIMVATDKCYENNGEGRAFVEIDPLGGHDPYSSSKAAAEIAVASWRESFLRAVGVNVCSARAGNVIGGGDYATDRIIPDAVRAFTSGVPLEVRSPLAVRPWQHVLEPLAGSLALAERAALDATYAGAWNFGPGAENEQDVATLAREACAIWGAGADWRRDSGGHSYEAPVLRLDAGKARAGLGWECRLGFRETLEWTLKFYRDCAQGADPAALMQTQIETYFAIVESGECASS